MRPFISLFILLLLVTFDAFADRPHRKLASSLSLADLRPLPDKAKTDRDEIQKKMFQPARIPDSDPKARVGVEATCTDTRNIIRTSQDPLYKDCLEERPRVAKPPLDASSAGGTTFGVRISR